MTMKTMKTKRWIGLLAAALTVLLVLPLVYAEDDRPERDRSQTQRLEPGSDESAAPGDEGETRAEASGDERAATRQRARTVRQVRSARPDGAEAGRGGMAAERRLRLRLGAGHESKIAGVLVTDVDPKQIDDDRVSLRPYWHGPFDGPDTLNLHVVTLLNDEQLDGEFDLVTRFILPDGHVFGEKIVPVDPASKAAREVDRPDLAPHPVEVRRPAPAGRVAKSAAMPASVEMPRRPSYVDTMLPCSGTSITKHGLYGTWTVQAIIRKDGKDIEMSETTFDIHR